MWNLEKQNQLNALLEQKKHWDTEQFGTLHLWFQLTCGDDFTENHMQGLIENATDVIRLLRPFSRIE